MKKITLPHLVFSSLYFVLAFFTILTLFLSGVVNDFKQMFRLVTQPFGIYFCTGVTFLLCGVIVSVFNMVRIYSSHLPKLYSAMIFVALCVFGTFLYYELFVLQRTYYDIFSLEDSLKFATNENAFDKSFYQMVMDYSFYLFFVVFPFIIYFFKLNFDKSTKIGKILQLMQPNINVMIVTLFGFAITSPMKSTADYIDFALLIVGLLMVGFLCLKRKYLIGFYEFLNLLLLLVNCLIIFCFSYFFVDGESYFEVRKAFYFLALFGWCNIWMMKLIIKPNYKD